MQSRLVLLALAALTAPHHAQQPSTALGGPIRGASAAGPAAGNEAMVIPGPGGETGSGGDVDFNRLRQLIEQSKNRPAPTPAQQKQAILHELQFDRSTAGILATRLEEARAAEPAKEVPPEVPVPVPPPAVEGQPQPPALNVDAAKAQQDIQED